MGTSEFWSSVGVCQPLFGPVSSLDPEPLQGHLPLLYLDPTLLEQDSPLHLSCIVCKALSLLASQSKYSWVLVLWISNLDLSVFHFWLEHSTTFRPSETSCLLRPGGGGRVLQPDLNLASAMRVRGSNNSLGRGRSRGAGTLGGTLNMFENWSSSLKPHQSDQQSCWSPGLPATLADPCSN